MDNALAWNAVALEANRVSHTNGKGEQTGPPLSSRALAIVHLAMHDTYAAILNTPVAWPTYLPVIPGAPTDSPLNRQLGLAGAAFTVLNTLFPSQHDYFAERLQTLMGDPTTARPQVRRKNCQSDAPGPTLRP